MASQATIARLGGEVLEKKTQAAQLDKFGGAVNEKRPKDILSLLGE